MQARGLPDALVEVFDRPVPRTLARAARGVAQADGGSCGEVFDGNGELQVVVGPEVFKRIVSFALAADDIARRVIDAVVALVPLSVGRCAVRAVGGTTTTSSII